MPYDTTPRTAEIAARMPGVVARNSDRMAERAAVSAQPRLVQSDIVDIDFLGLTDAELRRYLPEGIDLPDSIPAPIFLHALQMYTDMRRVDMQVLSQETGVPRRTLDRKVTDRNTVIGEIHWFNSRIILAEGLAMSQGQVGAKRLVTVYSHFLESAGQAPQLLHQLRDEPENTLRVITTNAGFVHGRVIQFIARFLRLEAEAGHFGSDLPVDALAFAIVRMGESFLYSEALSGDSTDYRHSVEMISRLLRPDER